MGLFTKRFGPIFLKENSDAEVYRKIKLYYIFTDAQMEDIIDKHPQIKEELLQVSGFGNVKVEKYGEEIIGVLKGSEYYCCAIMRELVIAWLPQ